MKAQNIFKKGAFFILMLTVFVGYHSNSQENLQLNTEFKGIVRNISDNKPLAYVDIHVKGTSIGTITNAEGEFLLKVHKTHLNKTVVISILGFKKKEVKLSSFNANINKKD